MAATHRGYARPVLLIGILAVLALSGILVVYLGSEPEPPAAKPKTSFRIHAPRKQIDASGFLEVVTTVPPWNADISLVSLSKIWEHPGTKRMAVIDAELADTHQAAYLRINSLVTKALLYNYEGKPTQAYELLTQTRQEVEQNDKLAEEWLYSLIYLQGITALRRGEDENCIMCRGECSCIIPIAPSAVHTNPAGARLAAQHFTEYLRVHPTDLEVKWLLTLAHMTLGDDLKQMPAAYRLPLDKFLQSEFDIGRFRDVGSIVGVNRFNQAGGAILDDFDGDGLLDFVVSSFDPTEQLSLFRNNGNGTFTDIADSAGLTGQLGGLNLCQTDYNNDGHLDIFVPRGAWLNSPIRPSLLRNNGNGTFTDVTKDAGLLDPVNSNHAGWADFDNDGFLDVFICCESQPNRLYRNKGDGTFENVTEKAKLTTSGDFCKGCAWIDYDNDGFPDLFVNNLRGSAKLFHNNRDGTFTEVTAAMGIDGPQFGFSCWAFDYDNDGWIDIFATSYDRTLAAIVAGLTGQPHTCHKNKLYRNIQGKRFQDVTKEAGLDMCFATMGCNYGDFDNDGYLDFYLATGEPNLATLVPNRMFKNVAGQRFAEITASSGTGHLQKGHGVACGDWDRNGTVDLFVELGGAINGDKYHTVLFQNPGQGNHWLNIKLIGKKSNRAAIGARITVVTAGPQPLTIHQQVSSGSSFGNNPLEQHIGLGKAERIERLEIHWPTSGATQTFRALAADQAIEITEFAAEYRNRAYKPIPLPK